MAESQIPRNLYDFHKSTPAQKSDKQYGKIIAEKMLETVKSGQNSYFSLRNERISRNRQFARGTQDMGEFLDLIGIDGKESYVNLHMKPPPIAPKFVQILVQRFMERQERPTVTAVDDISKKAKQRRKDEAEFRMHMGQDIAELEGAAGIPLEDTTAFTPEDKDDLELHFELEDRGPDEVLYEAGIWDILEDGNYEVFKSAVINSIVKDGFAVAKVYLDENKRIRYKYCQNLSVVYGYSQHDDFHDCTMVGELVKMKVSEFRNKYQVEEKRLFELYSASRQTPTTDNIAWQDDYLTSIYRPYDDVVIEVLDFEFITSDPKIWLKKTNSMGREIMTELKETPKKLKDREEILVKHHSVVYQGVYVVGGREMVSWALAENMIKPHEAMHEVLGSYVIQMPDNEDMKNMAIVERMENSIVQMTTSLLKMQQLKSELRPDEIAINAGMLTNVDLGEGLVQPMKLLNIFTQTGKAIWNQTGPDGIDNNQVPFQPLPMSSAAQKIMMLIQEYNFHLQLLRDMVGLNEASDGTGVGERTGLQVMNNQIGVSNRATDYIYKAYITLLNGVAKRISILLWWNITGGGKHYDYVTAGNDIGSKTYDLQITMLPTDADRQYIESITQTALTAGLISFEEAFRIRDISKKNIKLAQMYLAKYEKKRKQQQMEEAQAGAQANTQQQLASNQQGHQNAMQLKQAEYEGKLNLQDSMNQNDRTRMLSELVKAATSSPETAALLGPQKIAAMTDALLANLIGVQQSQVMGNQTDMQNQQMMQQQAAMVMEQQAQGAGQE